MNHNVIAIPPQELMVFLFLFLRTLLLFFLFPLFGVNFLPTKLKILLAVAISFSLTPILTGAINLPQDPVLLIPYLFLDFLLFFAVSYFFRLILGGVQLGGEIAGLQMGFGISQTFDPASGVAMPIVAQFLYLVFLLLFFTLDIHHYLIYFLVKSAHLSPSEDLMFGKGLIQYLAKRGSLIFEIGFKVLSAVLVFMFLVNVILAIVGRLLPQINILFVSFPLTVGLGLFVFGLTLVFLPRIFSAYIQEFLRLLGSFLRA